MKYTLAVEVNQEMDKLPFKMLILNVRTNIGIYKRIIIDETGNLFVEEAK